MHHLYKVRQLDKVLGIELVNHREILLEFLLKRKSWVYHSNYLLLEEEFGLESIICLDEQYKIDCLVVD